jgi:hypothetical protein
MTVFMHKLVGCFELRILIFDVALASSNFIVGWGCALQALVGNASAWHGNLRIGT